MSVINHQKSCQNPEFTNYFSNRVGRVLTQPSHNTVRADPHTAFPNKQRVAPYARAVLQPFRYSTNLLLQECSC